MLRRRIIPCLDVSAGRVVKGIEFVNLRDCGDPVDAAVRYAEQNADEIVWLNITASSESWTTLLAQVEQAAERVDVPGHGRRRRRHGRARARAAARRRRQGLDQLGRAARSVARRARRRCVRPPVHRRRDRRPAHRRQLARAPRRRTHAGPRRDVIEWAVEAVDRGAGELLVTSMDADGGQSGLRRRAAAGDRRPRRGAR